ncbi:unnamed protein product, partial [Ranitomeya imitator]
MAVHQRSPSNLTELERICKEEWQRIPKSKTCYIIPKKAHTCNSSKRQDGVQSNGFHTIHSENSPVKPRIVTVVKPGSHPLKKITLLLNRRSVQTFEQLIADISEGLGLPRWKNDRVRKLYNLKGKEIRSVSDFFRGDDVFIALGREQLTLKNIEIVFNELYPDKSFKQSREQYEKLRCKINENGINIDSGYEDTDTIHKLENICQSNKIEGKTHGKCRTEESRRTKKHDKCKDLKDRTAAWKKKNKCHFERKKCNDEHPDCSPIKSSRRLIEDFLEDTKENVLIKTDKIVTDNESNSKKENMANIDSTAQKIYCTKDKHSDIGEEVGVSQISQYYIKDRMDLDKYYEIGRSIGDGNFAVVKECRLRKTNQEFAMKIIDKAKLVGKEDIIENEVRIIKLLSHPNIVKLLHDFETDHEIFLIMEYIKGGDLFDAITESIKFTEHDAALMLTDLCEALVQNNPDGSSTLKLADFGLAVFVSEPIFTVCGTPTYVAPEILSEKGYGLEVDIWATGVILYILLCGFPPFRSPERNHEELFETIQRGEYEFLSPYWDSISDGKNQ